MHQQIKMAKFISKILKIFVLFCCFSIFYLANTGFAQSVQVKNFSKKTYGAAQQNWSVGFDNEGTVYVGNNLGLLEFDGISWKLNTRRVGSITRAVGVKDDLIFTGSYRELGFWKRDIKGNLTYTSLVRLVEDKFTQNEEFWNIICTDKSVYFHSFSGIYVYKSGTFSVIQPGEFVNFACKVENDCYVTIKDKGIYRVGENSFIPLVESSFFIGKTVRFILAFGHQQELLIGTETDGIFLWNQRDNSIVPWSNESNDFLKQNVINQGIVLKNGNILIGTILNGFVMLDKNGDKLQHYNVENGLQSNTVLGIGEDKYGNVWLTLDKGIDFISFQSTLAISMQYHLEIGALYSAARYHNVLYLGTNQGLYGETVENNHRFFSLVPNTQEQVWSCKVIDNQLFVGHNFGTFVMRDKSLSKISDYSGGFAIVPYPLDSNLLIQSTYSNLIVYKKQGETWKFARSIKGFNNLIRHLEFDHQFNLWASHLHRGIYKIELNKQLDSALKVKYYDLEQFVDRSGRNSQVFKIENRIVFTSERGFYTYDDLKDSIVPFKQLNESLGNYSNAFKIVAGPGNRYWFIGGKGVACFSINRLEVKKIKEYPNALFENQLIQNHENIIPLSESEALVCLENGYALLNTNSKEDGSDIEKFELQMKEFVVTNKHDEGDSLNVQSNYYTIPFSENSIMVRYSFPMFTGEKIYFQYKIDGLTDKWSNYYSQPLYNIKRIPAGDYVLKARAINQWGKTSQIHQLKFRINHPWYLSKIAYLLYVMAFAGILFYSRYMAVRRVKLREKRKSLIKERELIQLRNEKLRSDIAFKSQQLANSTMAIIKKNEFLLALKEKFKKQKTQLGVRYPDKYYQDIVKKIDDNISGQDDWKIFEANFDQAHETFLKNLKHSYPELTSSDLRLCAYLRINLTSKEIAPLMGISVRGVENHRYRLRKKLDLNSDDKLTDFILGI